MAQLVELTTLLVCTEPCVPSLAPHRSGIVVHSCGPPTTQRAEAGGSEVQGHPWIHSKPEAAHLKSK